VLRLIVTKSITLFPFGGMSNQNFTLAAVQSAPGPSIPAPVSTLANLGIVLLLSAGMSWVFSRQRSSPAVRPLDQRALELEPMRFTQSLQWVSYGKQLERSQQYKAAVAVYDRGLSVYPNDFRLWHERGLALAKLQQFEAAIASYDRAYQLRPQQRDLAHERGDALLQLGRYEEAVASFDVFLRFAPNNAHVLADRGYALFQLGRYQEALRTLKPLLKGDRRERDSRAYACYYYIEALRKSGQLEAALQVAQQAVEQHAEERFRIQYEALKQLSLA
jgi:tetratricopeptide (TPR) repeat protein